jgi:ABC-type uncharacterized transport system substrate-binding protein
MTARLLALFLMLGSSLASAAEIAVLKSADVAAWRPALDALRRGAPDQVFTEYELGNDPAEDGRVVARVKAAGTLVVAFGPLAAKAVREGAPRVPMVFCMVQDPAALGLAETANTWGVSFSVPPRNQLAAYRAVNPRGVRIGVIHGAESARAVADAQKAAPVLRLQVVTRSVASEREIPEALRSLLADKMDALWLPPDALLLTEATRRFLLSETLKAARPVYSFSAALVPEGALVSNGPDVVAIGAQAAQLVKRVLSGDGGAYEVVFAPTELVINKKVADKLKIAVPADALQSASRVF